MTAKSVNEYTRILRNTASGFLDYDAVIDTGVLTYETDTGNMKVGDGVKRYSELSYSSKPGDVDPEVVQEIVEDMNLGGGTTGKSQVLLEPGEIDSEATAVLILNGGGTYTVGNPQYDGQIIHIVVGDAVGLTITGANMAVGDAITPNGTSSIDLFAVDMTPLGGSFAWFIRPGYVASAA